MDFIAIDLDKYDVWQAFIQPVPVKAQMYIKTANWNPGEDEEEGCQDVAPGDACASADKIYQQTIATASPSLGGSSPDGAFQEPGGDFNPGIPGGGLTAEQMACAAGQAADRARNEAAKKAHDEIKKKMAEDGRSGTDQPEYAISGFYNDDSSVSVTPPVLGESYDEHNPPRTPIPSLNDPAYEISDFAFIAHSHGFTNNSSIALENQAPSNGDWQVMDAFNTAGIDMNNFVMFIIDQDGVMRAYKYQLPAERQASSQNPRGTVSSGESVSNDTVRECS